MADRSQTKRKRTNNATESDLDETPSKKKATTSKSSVVAREAEFEKKFENGLVKVTNVYKQNATQSV